MVKLEQALILEPENELHFKAPYDTVTTSYLKLNNPTDQRICFKLKTTAPKTYCVRPNAGMVQPKESVTVAVMFYGSGLDLADKSKHKFMVQTLYVPDGDVNQEELWREAEPIAFMNSKLKCVFDSESSEKQHNLAPDCFAEEIPSSGVDANVDSEFMSISPPVQTNAAVAEESNKLNEENRQLRTFIAELKHENALLKETSLRLRQVSQTAAASAANAGAPEATHAQAAKQSWFLAHMYIIFFIVFILGLLMGHNIFRTS